MTSDLRSHSTTPKSRADVVVVGAGIVGLAVAREVLRRRPGSSLVVVDKESDVAAHQTGHNSGVIHSGIYYKPGSLKAQLCVRGAALMYEYAQQHGIAHEACGKLIVAVRPAELAGLDELERRGVANGVPGLRRLDQAEIAEIEPRATGLAALHVPRTGIIDYRAVTGALRHELEQQGAKFQFDTLVRSIRDGAACRVVTNRGVISAGQVITCAGLWADRLARESGARPDPRIVPFRGAYLCLRPSSGPVVRGMVYPVPDPTLPFLGVHVTRQVDGRVMLGPTALMVAARDGYLLRTMRARDAWETATWPGTWKVARRYWRTGANEIHLAVSRSAYVRAVAQYVPSITLADLERTTQAGVRAQAVGRDGTLVDDFLVSHSGAVAHVRNAPSPAATSAFALAEEVVRKLDRR